MKPQSRKNKGRNLQKAVCRLLSDVFSWKEGDAESRSMGAGGVDILLSPKAREDFPHSIECKSTKKFPSLSALDQSKENCYTGTIPSVIWKPPGKGPEHSIIYFNLIEYAKWRKECLKQKKESG